MFLFGLQPVVIVKSESRPKLHQLRTSALLHPPRDERSETGDARIKPLCGGDVWSMHFMPLKKRMLLRIYFGAQRKCSMFLR